MDDSIETAQAWAMLNIKDIPNMVVFKHDTVRMGQGIHVIERNAITNEERVTKIMIKPERETVRSRSKYLPHQSTRECQRRVRQMAHGII